MPRNLPAAMISGPGSLTDNLIRPALLAEIHFKSQVSYIWSGVGNLVWNAHTYLGVGSLGRISHVSAGVDLAAGGVVVSLSGIDSQLFSESMTDIQLGAPATISFALFDAAGNILGAPRLFGGVVDKPTITPGLQSITISLNLETRFTNLQRPNARRYTAADQHVYYPDDTAFQWVEQLNDQALKWG
jgi:hypothetical protein